MVSKDGNGYALPISPTTVAFQAKRRLRRRGTTHVTAHSAVANVGKGLFEKGPAYVL